MMEYYTEYLKFYRANQRGLDAFIDRLFKQC